MATMPALMARNRALSRVIYGSRRGYVIETYDFIGIRGAKSYHKGGAQALRDARALDGGVARQALCVGRVVLPADQRQKVAPARRRDAESVGRDEVARHLFL